MTSTSSFSFSYLNCFTASIFVAQRYRIYLQCRRSGFDSWVRKISWRRKWQLTPLFLPGKSQGQRNLVGYSPWSHKESDMTEWLNKNNIFFWGVKKESKKLSRVTVLTGACACLEGVLRATGREKGRLSVDWEVRSRRLNWGKSQLSSRFLQGHLQEDENCLCWDRVSVWRALGTFCPVKMVSLLLTFPNCDGSFLFFWGILTGLEKKTVKLGHYPAQREYKTNAELCSNHVGWSSTG